MARNLTIGVTGPQRGIPWAWWAMRRQLLRQRVAALRLHAGLGKPDGGLAGVIIGGGNDVDPAIYGGDVSCSPNVDHERDGYELAILEEADRRGLPVLGICRGAQLINVHAGGTLIGDLKRHRVLTSNKGTLLPRKRVVVEPNSTLADWLSATTTRVNSLHHQAVKETGRKLKVAAHDCDGIVQAIESASGPLRLGVQWHPEYMPQRRDQRRLFDRFVDTCRAYQSASG